MYSFLLQKDVKLRFLQILAPGRVYPNKMKGADVPHTDAQVASRRKFRIEDVGLAWETVDTLHVFMYPGRIETIYYNYIYIIYNYYIYI